jgi:DNA-binding MarR family transcriptional regulator
VSRLHVTRKQLVQAILAEARSGSTRSVLLHAAVAERLGLNASDLKCADLILAEEGSSTPGRLAELTGLSTGAITGVLDRLEHAGFVAREADPDDRRRTVVRLVRGRAPNLERIFAPLAKGMERVCANYTQDELEVILGFMRASQEMMIEAAKAVRKPS